jgi:hypothetical protein
MATVKMEYTHMWCILYETGDREVGAAFNNGCISPHACAGFDECEHCLKYKQDKAWVEEWKREHGDMDIIGGPCRYEQIETIYEERSMKRFTAREGRTTGYEYWEGWILETNKREYPCTYLEIDGYVYCDLRKTGDAK